MTPQEKSLWSVLFWIFIRVLKVLKVYDINCLREEYEDILKQELEYLGQFVIVARFVDEKPLKTFKLDVGQ